MVSDEIMEQLNAVVYGLRKRGQDLTPVMLLLTSMMEQAISRNFNDRGRYNPSDVPPTIWSGGTSKWKALAKSTEAGYAFSRKFKNRQILKRSGRLYRQIEILPTGKTKIKISAKTPYSRIHQEGGTVKATNIKVTKKMKKYFWRRHFKESDKEMKSLWKAMALSNTIKRKAFKIDARPYIVFTEDDLKDMFGVVKSFIFPA